MNKNVLVKEISQERTEKGKHWKTVKENENMISLEQFKESFVKERWEGEKRLGYEYTPFGYFQRKTINENPFSKGTERTVREFTFGV